MQAVNLCRYSSHVSKKNYKTALPKVKMQKNHKNSMNQSEFSLGYDNMSQSMCNTTSYLGGEYNRKEKSLGELCRRFLTIYGKEEKDFLLLDQCTQELNVERRRIYDIINILESFCVIRRQAKNSYQWRGIDKIIHSIDAQIVSLLFSFRGGPFSPSSVLFVSN